MTKTKQILGFIVCLIITYAAAAVGAIASVSAGAFYVELIRPAWAPPAWLFSPVWSILYTLIGISAWLAWRKAGSFNAASCALTLYILQLITNALWTWIFFTWRQGAFASVEIILLWILIICTIIAFWKIQTAAGILLLPYLAWVTFASVLTFTVWRLNPAILG